MDPAGFVFAEWINFGKIKFLSDVDKLCKQFPELAATYRRTLSSLVHEKIVRVDESSGRIIKLVDKVNLNSKPEQLLSFLPDLAQRAFEKVINDYCQGIADKSSDIGETIAFPDDPETRGEVTAAAIEFRRKLAKIQSDAKKRNAPFRDIRLLNISSGSFAMEDC